MKLTMIHKIQHGTEALFMLLVIQWQPVFGIIASACAILYYLSITKINVVDVKHDGSWFKYFKSMIRL
jgi:hypothetical protein